MKELQDRWECCVSLETTYHDSFESAFRELFKKLKAIKILTWQMLESATWIKDPNETWPIYFYEARDRACKEGLLVNGKLVDEKV